MLGFNPKKMRKGDAAAQAAADESQAAIEQSQAFLKAQAQNAAPDSIPGMFKPGEFVLPPDTVNAMGGKNALQGAVDATHTPVNPVVAGAGAQGFQPEVFFANGGAPEDQLNRAASPGNVYPGNQLPGNSGATSAVGAPQPPPSMDASQFGSSGKLAQIPAGIGGNPGAPPRPAQPAAAAPTAPMTAPAQSVAVQPVVQPAAQPAAQATMPAMPPPSRAPSPGNTFPGNRLQSSSGFSGAPVAPPPAAAPMMTPLPESAAGAGRGFVNPVQVSTAGAGRGTIHPPLAEAAAAAAPAAAPAPAPDQKTSRSLTGQFLNDIDVEASNQIRQGNYAQGAGTYARGAAQGLGMGAIEATGAILSPAWNAAKGFGKGLFGIEDAQAAPAPAPAPVAGQAAAPSAAASSNAAGAVPQDAWQSRPGYATQPQQASAAQSQKTSAPSPAAQQVAPGVYQHGRGQFSDQAGGMAFNSSFTGQPSAQNMRAADALQSPATQALQQAQAAPAGEGEGSYQAPVARHSGNDWQARQHLKNLETSASSIMNDPRWAGKRAYTRADTQNFMEAQRADVAARGRQPDLDSATMGHNTAQAKVRQDRERLGLEATRLNNQSASDQRRAGIDQQRVGIDQQRLGIDQQRADNETRSQGFSQRANERLEGLYNKYSDPKTPDAERAEIAKQLRVLGGKDANGKWKMHVTPTVKNADGSTTEGSVYRINEETGQAEQVAGGRGTQQPQLTVGRTYKKPDGTTGRWTENGWGPV